MQMMITVDQTSRFIFKVLVTTIIASRLLTFFAFPNGFTSPDSDTYLAKEWLDFSNVSFIGHAIRPWPVPLIYALLGNIHLIIFFQLVLSGFVWIHLLRVINKSLVTSTKKSLLLMAIGILSISPQVIQWDTALLATSLLFSTLILLISLSLEIIFHKFRESQNILFIAIVIFLLCQKISNLVIVLMFWILLFVCLRSKLKKIFIITLTLGIIYGCLLGFNVDKYWKASYSGTSMLWQLGKQNPSASSFKDFLIQHSAPSCVTQNAPFGDISYESSRILNSCPESIPYLRNQFSSDFIKFSITDPKEVAYSMIQGSGALLSNQSSNYGGSITLLPSPINSLIFGISSPDFKNMGIDSQIEGTDAIGPNKPFWVFTPQILFLFLGPILLFRQKFKGVKTLLLLWIGLVIEICINLYLIPGEWVRQSTPFLVSAIALSLAMIIRSESSSGVSK